MAIFIKPLKKIPDVLAMETVKILICADAGLQTYRFSMFNVTAIRYSKLNGFQNRRSKKLCEQHNYFISSKSI
jgi:hypothetical protein